MAISINKVTNANVYVNGGSQLGRAMEIDLPEITQKMADHVALGMVATTELPVGVDKMEATIRWNGFYEEVIKLWSNPYQVLDLQIRASVKTFEAGGLSAEKPMLIFLRGYAKTHQLGNFKQHENAEFENQMTVLYVRVEYNGNEMLELDANANIYRVNGVDIIADYKTNIGQ